ncbi:unnamed protein product [Coregonus sp. 'balchen']|nr:unnamed protein product [Coregonus sp. 'balchen']
MFRQGMHDLKVWPGVDWDGWEPTSTPGRTSSRLAEDQMGRLAKVVTGSGVPWTGGLTKAHRQGHMVKVDWLDRLTFREIEMINELGQTPSITNAFACEYVKIFVSPFSTLLRYLHLSKVSRMFVFPQSEKRCSNFMYLMVEFPRVKTGEKPEYSIVYYEKDEDDASPVLTSADIVKVPDPQMCMENLVESKHHKLAHSLSDHDLKPNAATRDQLNVSTITRNNVIVNYPPTEQLSSEEQDLEKVCILLDTVCVFTAEYISLYFLKYEIFTDIQGGLDPGSKRDSQGRGESSTLGDLDRNEKKGRPARTSSRTWCTFLISRACKNSTLANYLYWYIIVECEGQDTQQRDLKTHNVYLNVIGRFSLALLKGDKSVRVMRSLLASQQTFVVRLVQLMKAVQRESDNRKKKVNLCEIDPIPVPLEPTVRIRGIVPDTTSLFKSSLMPAKLIFKAEEGKLYPVSFKHGDDLRQDQLILQSISLMDKLLRKENLDLTKCWPQAPSIVSTTDVVIEYCLRK